MFYDCDIYDSLIAKYFEVCMAPMTILLEKLR